MLYIIYDFIFSIFIVYTILLIDWLIYILVFTEKLAIVNPSGRNEGDVFIYVSEAQASDFQIAIHGSLILWIFSVWLQTALDSTQSEYHYVIISSRSDIAGYLAEFRYG